MPSKSSTLRCASMAVSGMASSNAPVSWLKSLLTCFACDTYLRRRHCSQTLFIQCIACLQGEDPDYAWALTVIGFYLKLLFGLLGVVLSVCWLVQIVVYIFISPPATPFLNSMFTRLDKIFGLFGVAAFALFCFYIIGEPSHLSFA